MKVKCIFVFTLLLIGFINNAQTTDGGFETRTIQLDEGVEAVIHCNYSYSNDQWKGKVWHTVALFTIYNSRNSDIEIRYSFSSPKAGGRCYTVSYTTIKANSEKLCCKPYNTSVNPTHPNYQNQTVYFDRSYKVTPNMMDLSWTIRGGREYRDYLASAEKYMDNAQKNQSVSDCDKALEYYKAAYKANPFDKELLDVYYNNVSYCDQLRNLANERNLVNEYRRKADNYFNSQQFDRAIEYYEKLAVLRPDFDYIKQRIKTSANLAQEKRIKQEKANNVEIHDGTKIGKAPDNKSFQKYLDKQRQQRDALLEYNMSKRAAKMQEELKNDNQFEVKRMSHNDINSEIGKLSTNLDNPIDSFDNLLDTKSTTIKTPSVMSKLEQKYSFENMPNKLLNDAEKYKGMSSSEIDKAMQKEIVTDLGAAALNELGFDESSSFVGGALISSLLFGKKETPATIDRSQEILKQIEEQKIKRQAWFDALADGSIPRYSNETLYFFFIGKTGSDSANISNVFVLSPDEYRNLPFKIDIVNSYKKVNSKIFKNWLVGPFKSLNEANSYKQNLIANTTSYNIKLSGSSFMANSIFSDSNLSNETTDFWGSPSKDKLVKTKKQKKSSKSTKQKNTDNFWGDEKTKKNKRN